MSSYDNRETLSHHRPQWLHLFSESIVSMIVLAISIRRLENTFIVMKFSDVFMMTGQNMSTNNLDEYCARMAWKSMWMRGGRIEEVAWIDRDVIAWHCGAHLVFFHLVDKKQTLFSCLQFPDGVCCISGHQKLHLIAFAERSRDPRILIYCYPEMTQVSQCCSGSESGYLATAFGFSHYLISLGSCPDYQIIIWSWKSGEKLSSISTPIHDLYGQMIRVYPNQPMLIAQLGRGSKTLLIWTVNVIRDVIISHEQIILPDKIGATYIDWSLHRQNPELVIVDENGNVYTSNTDGTVLNRVVLSQRCAVCVDYEIPIVCWTHDGIMLKTTFCQIRYYKKNREDDWKREAYIESEFKPYIMTVNPVNIKEILYFTEEGYVMQMKLSITGGSMLTANKIFYYGGIYRFIDFVHPWAHDLVVVDANCNLRIVDVTNGESIGELCIESQGKVTQLISHPDHPLVILITASGEFFAITAHKRYEPSVRYFCQLQNDELDILKFSQCGEHLIAGTGISGSCFCFTHIVTTEFSNIVQLKVKRAITDIALYDAGGVIRIIILILPSRTGIAGNNILIYELLPNETNSAKPKIIARLPAFYQYIHFAPGNDNILTATPYQSRQIHYFKCSSQMQMELMECKTTLHHIRGFKIHTDRRYIITCGTDGVVTVSNGRANEKNPVVVLTHHRADIGVVRAICTPTANTLIAAGQNGSIVCFELRSSEKYQKKIIESDYESLDESILGFLSGPHKVIPSGNMSSITWTEWKNNQILMRDAEIFRKKKMEIRAKLIAMKINIRHMLNENEKCEGNAQLPVAAFDLAIFAREQKIKLARKEREEVRLQLDFECSSMSKVAQWIRAIFWDAQKILLKSIYSIFSDYRVTNYPTISADPQEKQMFAWCKYFENSKIELKHVRSELECCLLMKSRYSPIRSDSKSDLENVSIDDEVYDDSEGKGDEQYECEGITTYNFIQPSSIYSQFEHYSFPQFIVITDSINYDLQQLKSHFNKLFEQMYNVKNEVMTSCLERNRRIRHIDLELKLLFNQCVPEIFVDPVWHIREQPHMIIDVLDSEVMARLYNFDSQQRFMNNEVCDGNRCESQLINNNFYEKKLSETMDGVLEVRWVDLIKKDIIQPQCMLIKSPDQYNVEDILAIQKYEIDVQGLTKEREKYRKILEADFSRIITSTREDVERFDSSLRDLSMTKIKIESSIQQLNLLCARGYLHSSHRLKILEDIDGYHIKIGHIEQRIKTVLNENDLQRLILQDLQNQREVLFGEEKAILQQFRVEFRSCEKIMIEILKKLFKKRPKLSMTKMTADDLLELGRCVVSRSKNNFLRQYCAEYLIESDIMDIRPIDLPDAVTSSHWACLTKIRRDKVELEMQLKANRMKIDVIDESIACNVGRIERLQCLISEFQDQLNRLNREQLELISNTQIQLILRMGQVEINLSGRENDAIHSILLPRQEIIKINDKILQAGEEKLEIVKGAMKFSRKRSLKEWRHKCLQMNIAYLQDDLREIRNFPVTRYVRVHSIERANGSKNERLYHGMDRQIDAMQMNFEKSLRESIGKLMGLEAKIDKITKENRVLDKVIARMNVSRWELELERNLNSEDRCRDFASRKMALLRLRSKIVSRIQHQYAINLALKKEYDLFRLKRLPMIA